MVTLGACTEANPGARGAAESTKAAAILDVAYEGRGEKGVPEPSPAGASGVSERGLKKNLRRCLNLT
jgi:hypothetical protein